MSVFTGSVHLRGDIYYVKRALWQNNKDNYIKCILNNDYNIDFSFY